MEPWTWEVLALMTAAVLLNTVGLIAWKRGAVGQWHLSAVRVAVLALLIGDGYSHWLRAFSSVAALTLGLYGLWRGSAIVEVIDLECIG
jgi:hypothetical protein